MRYGILLETLIQKKKKNHYIFLYFLYILNMIQSPLYIILNPKLPKMHLWSEIYDRSYAWIVNKIAN